MADNVTADPGSGGATFATDEDTGNSRHVPWVKLMEGADGTFNEVGDANPLPVNWGGTAPPIGAGTEAAALRVTVATDSTGVVSVDDNGGSLTVDGTVTANLSATDNAVLDSIDTNTGFGAQTGGGVEASALRVTLANDSTGVLSVDDNGGSLTVDGTVTADAGAGTFTVDGSGVTQPVSNTAIDNAHSADFDSGAGTDTTSAFGIAVPASGGAAVIPGDATAGLKVDLGADNDVTVSGTVTANLSATDNAVLDQIDSNTDYGAQTGGGVEASALRVTIANDSTGVLSIDDNGGSITVDGTVTANLSATDNAVLDSIDTAVNGTLSVDLGANNDVSLNAGSNLVGDVGISGARTSGGTTLYKNIDVDESEDEIKGTAGQIYWLHAMNMSSGVRYLKFYNATAASVVVGTTPPDLTFPIPTQGDTNGAGFNLAIPNGIAFGTAITIAATTGVADNDSGAPGANEVIVNLGYA